MNTCKDGNCTLPENKDEDQELVVVTEQGDLGDIDLDKVRLAPELN